MSSLCISQIRFGQYSSCQKHHFRCTTKRGLSKETLILYLQWCFWQEYYPSLPTKAFLPEARTFLWLLCSLQNSLPDRCRIQGKSTYPDACCVEERIRNSRGSGWYAGSTYTSYGFCALHYVDFNLGSFAHFDQFVVVKVCRPLCGPPFANLTCSLSAVLIPMIIAPSIWALTVSGDWGRQYWSLRSNSVFMEEW